MTYRLAFAMRLVRFSARSGRERRLGCSQASESRRSPTPTAIVAAMSTSPPPATALPPPTAQSGIDRRALVAILLGAGLASLDTAIANTALPTIAADLQARLPGAIWIINAYQLTVVASLLPFAALADLVGPRRVFIGGLAFFTAASAACALAASLPQLAAARALQGLGAGALTSARSWPIL